MPNQEAPTHGILSVWHSFCNKFPSGIPQMRKKILIVEDIPVLIHILLLEVQRLGYETILASNGEEAVEIQTSKGCPRGLGTLTSLR